MTPQEPKRVSMVDLPKTLSLNQGTPAPTAAEADSCMLLEHAIANRLCVRWTYNRTPMQAEPHVLYRKKNGVYLDAIVTERSSERPVETKLGSFKLTGLTQLTIVNAAFSPSAVDLTDARYAEGIIVKAPR